MDEPYYFVSMSVIKENNLVGFSMSAFHGQNKATTIDEREREETFFIIH
jgi:hypothetical protein